MEFDKFKILVKGLKAVYTSERFLPDGDSIKIWYQMLGDLDYKTLSLAIQKYIMTNKFPPTIADLRDLAAAVTAGEIPDWGDGWEQVLSAIRRFGMYRVAEAMDSFDEITKQCIERLGFREICLSENINHDRANFRMIYEELAGRKRVALQVSPKVQQQISLFQSEQLKLEE